ncbi:putative mei2-like RNA recognition, RNA-binding domain superfamily [Helianthus debilis subsp. tardiflorus]
MIRNIPNNYTSLLVEFLESHCKHENEKAGNTIRSAFDFVYLPVDFKHRLNAGYAFVNFTTSEAAWRFRVSVKGKKWDLFKSKKIADVSRARIQGKDALVKNFERMRLCSPSWEYLPVWFEPPRDGCMMGSSSKMHTVGEVQVGR